MLGKQTHGFYPYSCILFVQSTLEAVNEKRGISTNLRCQKSKLI
ncbi:hypothetical protein ACVPOR_16615 [Staphylococcus aureus]